MCQCTIAQYAGVVRNSCWAAAGWLLSSCRAVSDVLLLYSCCAAAADYWVAAVQLLLTYGLLSGYHSCQLLVAALTVVAHQIAYQVKCYSTTCVSIVLNHSTVVVCYSLLVALQYNYSSVR
jgi:hypothetical protein